MAASRPGAIDGARAHARRSARDMATMCGEALRSPTSLWLDDEEGKTGDVTRE
jgi:hypothetical protein